MTSIQKHSIEIFRSGMNCTQAVVTAFAGQLQYDTKLAQGISAGFGSGMGRMQYTCGAVTGAFMVLGILNFQKSVDISNIRETSYSMIQEFSKMFQQKHSSIDCASLLKCDLKTEQGREYFATNKLKENICEACILSSVQILEEMISQNA
jgi:C_GCAxxG_C_C family probable redox protein